MDAVSGTPAPDPATPATRLRHAALDLVRAGRAEGIEPDGPLGLWLEGQARALGGLADVLDGQTRRFDETLARIEDAAKVELAKLSAAIGGANQIARQGELALRQARQVHLAMVAEQETVVVRMMRETLPMFAERLQKVLVVREQRWNADLRRRRYALTGAVTLAVFMAGFALSWWQDSGLVSAFDRCLEHPLQAAGRFYCSLDSLVAAPPPVGK
jgi:hypothetical protein